MIPLDTKAAFIMISWMEKQGWDLEKVNIIRVILWTGSEKVKVCISMKTEMNLKVSGKMIKNIQEFISTILEDHLKESSKQERCPTE